MVSRSLRRSLRQVPWRTHVWPIVGTLLFTVTLLGGSAQVVYALWLHATDPCVGLLYSAACHDKLHYFGSEQGEVIAASAVAGLNLAICLAYIALQIPRLVRNCRAAARAGLACWRLARELLVRISRRVYMLFAGIDSGFDAERIRQEFERLRVRRMQTMIRTVFPISVVVVLWNVSRLFLLKLVDISLRTSDADAAVWADSANAWSAKKTEIRELYWVYLFGSNAMQFLSMQFPAFIINVFPSVATPRFIDLCYVLTSLAGAWTLTVSWDDGYAFNHHWLNVVRLFIVFFHCNAKVSTFCNISFYLIECANTAIRPPPPDHARANVMFRDALVLVGIIVLAWALERFQMAEARLLVQAKKSDRSLALVWELLSCMCDAVLRLDADMCLTEPCPSLGALVLRGGPVPQGTHIADLISPDDSDRFRGCLTAPLSAPPTQDADQPGAKTADGFAGLCHLRLRVCYGLMPTSVFYSCVPGVDGLPTFLLGVREDLDEAGGPALPAPPAQTLAALPESAAAAPVDADEVSSSAWSSGTEDEAGEAVAELSVWVDASDENLRVLSCSPGFARLGGTRGPCSDLSKWLSDSGINKIWSLVDLRIPGREHVHLRPIEATSYACSVRLGPAGAAAPALDAAAAANADPVRLDFRVKGASAERSQGRDRDRRLVKEALTDNRIGPLRATQLHGQQGRQRQRHVQTV